MNYRRRSEDEVKAVEHNQRLKEAMADIKKMPVKEFRQKGYLQELNRRFLHPLGLALEVIVHEDGSESFGGVWDAQDQPEGIIYDPTMLDPRKSAYVHNQASRRTLERFQTLGFIIQPD